MENNPIINRILSEKLPSLFEHTATLERKPFDDQWLMKKGYVLKGKDGCCEFSSCAIKLREKLDSLFLELFQDENYHPMIFSNQYSLSTLSAMGYDPNALVCDKTAKNKAFIPAACLPIYEFVGNKGIDDVPTIFSIRNKVRRTEKTYDSIFTLSEFQQREFVIFGTKDHVEEFITRGCEKLKSLVQKINISASLDISNDIFYQDNNPAKALFQIASKSKIELRVRIKTVPTPIALSSCNNHRTHFSKKFTIQKNKKLLHTGCIAFGLDRWVLASLMLWGKNSFKIIESFFNE